MKKFNTRLRRYRDRDTACALYMPAEDAVPEVICIDMKTARRLPVALSSAWRCLWQYVIWDDLATGQQIFSGRPRRFCNALISLIMSRIYSSQGFPKR